MDRRRLDSNIEAIRTYWNENPDLLRAHHFLYDLPLNRDAGPPEVVVMGINPGETQADRDACVHRTEETWLFDFLEKSPKRSKGSINWRNKAEFFSQGKSVVFTELFFWSSNNEQERQERFGTLWNSEHLRFCVGMNRSLLQEYQPKLVLFVGLSCSKRVAQEFGLRFVASLKDENNHRLVEHYEDDDRPWFFTKHWSGSFGFSGSQQERIREYIRDRM